MRVGFGTWRLLSTGIVLLAIGIAFIVMISGEMADYSKKGADYSTLQWSDFKEGMMIEGDLPVKFKIAGKVYAIDRRVRKCAGVEYELAMLLGEKNVVFFEK